MCEDITHNKGKSVHKKNCALYTPSLMCRHGKRTCNECKPGITNQLNQITRHRKERGTFFSHTAAEFLALTEEKQSELPLDFMYLRDKAIIESSTEEKRKVMRDVKKQVPGRAVVLQITSGLRSDQCLFGAIQGRDFS
jgi:hypothetical protein